MGTVLTSFVKCWLPLWPRNHTLITHNKPLLIDLQTGEEKGKSFYDRMQQLYIYLLLHPLTDCVRAQWSLTHGRDADEFPWSLACATVFPPFAHLFLSNCLHNFPFLRLNSFIYKINTCHSIQGSPYKLQLFIWIHVRVVVEFFVRERGCLDSWVLCDWKTRQDRHDKCFYVNHVSVLGRSLFLWRHYSHFKIFSYNCWKYSTFHCFKLFSISLHEDLPLQ